MALTAQAVLTRAGRALNDTGMTRWSEAELLEYLSDAQRAAVQIRPETNSVTITHPLAPGTRQAIPDDGYILIDAVRNMGEAGDTPGRVITPVERAALDQVNPSWHSATANGVVTNFIYDIRNRRQFYVSPPQPDPAHRIEIIYAKMPEEITAAADALGLDDIYLPALTAYVLHMAYIKDIPAEGQGPQRSGAFLDKFQALMIGKAEESEADLTIRHETVESTARP